MTTETLKGRLPRRGSRIKRAALSLAAAALPVVLLGAARPVPVYAQSALEMAFLDSEIALELVGIFDALAAAQEGAMAAAETALTPVEEAMPAAELEYVEPEAPVEEASEPSAEGEATADEWPAEPAADYPAADQPDPAAGEDVSAEPAEFAAEEAPESAFASEEEAAA